MLAAAGYHAGPHDIVAPALGSRVHDGTAIIFKRGRQLNLDVDGVPPPDLDHSPDRLRRHWPSWVTRAPTSSRCRGRGACRCSPTDITVRTPKQVTVVHDGRSEQVTTTDRTVDELLRDLRIPVGAHDLVSVSRTSAVRAGERIVVRRVRRATVVEGHPAPFGTTAINDSSLAYGVTRTVKPGAAGVARTTYAVVYIDGKLVGRTKIRTVVLRAPSGRIVKVGTARPVVVRRPVASTPAPVYTTPAPPTGVMMSPAQAQAYARTALAARGWGADQFSCLVPLWGHESGWRVNASNGSGAYGIPQALPGSKMGAGWQTDARVQIGWGLNYIAARYGTPCGAWAVWQSQGWY